MCVSLKLDALGLRNCGHSFCKPVHATFHDPCPAVNIAARLQEVAESDMILVSATVAKFLQSQEITPIEPLELKGVQEEILMFSVSVDF